MTIRHVVPVARKAATGRVAAVYTQSLADFGQAAFMMLSPAPEIQAATWALLREAELVGRAPRVSKEVIAVAVSQANGCRFCIDAHTIMIHAHGTHDLAEDLLHDRIPAEPAHAELAAWAASTRRLDAIPPHARPFPAEHAAEYLGTALATHFTNRMFSAFTDEQLMPGNLQRSGVVRRVGAMAYTRVMQRELAPGDSLPLLDGITAGLSPAWAAGTPIAAAFAALGGATASGGDLLSTAAREIIYASVARWDGAHLPPSGAWLAEALAGLPAAEQPGARLALLASIDPHRIDAGAVAAWRATGHSDDAELVRLVAYGAFTAVQRIADTITDPATMR
ncbi:AhpD family alkylhydroperoxidase [Hamadaea flava]|uniref:Carboxymuconolactone decarboxylase family protein n=1 Tax=Hamadaea flava TaxID=1742688 RepID=A0ABV8LP49_9ACTN|nr:carboxymuconolactone decarboxylase family protein [Hamadaea flava]MCP2323293.1 AhpD family alkylhydroperoxidase [Hamadaea flava]